MRDVDVVIGYLGNDRDQLVDRDHAVLSDVERLIVIRFHQQKNGVQAVVDVAKRPGLLSVSPDFDRGALALGGQSDFSADGRGSFLPTALPASMGPEDIVEAAYPKLQWML